MLSAYFSHSMSQINASFTQKHRQIYIIMLALFSQLSWFSFNERQSTVYSDAHQSMLVPIHDDFCWQPMPSRSVCLAIVFVDSLKINKHSFTIFSLWGSQTILVFPQQTSWRYSDEDPRMKVQKSQF